MRRQLYRGVHLEGVDCICYPPLYRSGAPSHPFLMVRLQPSSDFSTDDYYLLFYILLYTLPCIKAQDSA